MPFYPQLQTQLEISASTQLKAAPGHMLKFLVHTRSTDKTKVWRVWDSASGPVSGDPGNIVGAWYADDPKVSPGSVVEVDWPCKEEIYLEIPPGGVCSAEWI